MTSLLMFSIGAISTMFIAYFAGYLHGTDSEQKLDAAHRESERRRFRRIEEEHGQCAVTIRMLEENRRADRLALKGRIAALSQELAARTALVTPPPLDPRAIALQRAYALSDTVLESTEEQL